MLTNVQTSTSSRTFTHRSIKISWTLSMISGVAVSIGRLERGASHVDVRSHLNSFIQLYTVANVGADVLWTLSNSTLISFGVKSFIHRYLITARNSFFSILQKIQRLFALIIYRKFFTRNYLTRWIPFKIWYQSIISWEMLLVKKNNVTWRCECPLTDFLRNLLTCPRINTNIS